MKVRTSFLTRCLALVLALVLVASCANLGVALRVLAAGSTGSEVTAGKLVADNYGLTDAEKALLSSGNLLGESYPVPAIGDGLVAVDNESKKITAKSNEGWVPTAATIIVDGEGVETVALTNGEGTYAYTGNAFSVSVAYELNVEVPVETQQTLLNAAAWLKQGLANLANSYNSTDTNLGTVVLAADTLKQLADGISMNFGAFSMTAKFGTDAIAAVKELRAQISANGDKLDLQVANAAYNASASKVQYLLENGAAYKATLVSTYNYLNAIKNDPLANNDLLDSYLQGSDPSSYTQWMAFKAILGNLVSAMEPVVNADWTAAEKGTALVKAGANYATLDTLVSALDATTAVTADKASLLAGTTSVQVNMSMKNVDVTVLLKVVEDKADSAELVTYGDAHTVRLTLADNASNMEIVAAIADSGIEAAAKAAWGEAYVEGSFVAENSVLPDTLVEDIEYTVTYTPATYTVTYGYATEAPTSVPYGYQMTLPRHDDAVKAYDYKVNGETYAQGSVYTVVGDTEISRGTGKAYTSTDLYTVIADNFGNDTAKAILKSGALLDNEVISYRQPDPTDAKSLLTLADGELKVVAEYASDYNGLSWTPNTYGETGVENTFSGTTAKWSGKDAKVQYILELTNVEVDAVAAILQLAADLKSEAAAQKATLDAFAANQETMGQLDKTKLGALNGVIDVTDFTPDDGVDTDEANLEMRAYFKSMVSGIIANNLDSNNYLKIYNILGEYKNEGLRYYYENYETVIAEIESLSGYLSGMLADDEKVAALEIMVGAAGFPDYADKIADLETKLTDVLDSLSEPNAAIDLESEKLGALVTALTAQGDVVCEKAATPYLLSQTLTALDQSQVNVQVIIETGKGSATVTTPAMDKGTVLTQEVVDSLKAQVDAKVAELLGADAKYYAQSAAADLDSLVGTEITANVNIEYTYTVKEYTVVIDGEANQTVTINDLEINLPKHPTNGWVYKYTVDGTGEITSSTYTFTTEQLDRLFVNGSYTITREAIDQGEEQAKKTFEIVKDENGNVIELVSSVDGNKDGLMGFAMGLVNSGYTYIALNGEDFLYMNEQDTLEICLQSLINALLNDNSFGSQTLIDLGNNGKGNLVKTKISLGNSAEDLVYENVDYSLNLNSVPGQMATVATGLSTIKNYMTFQSSNGVMNVDLNLPEKVYEVYLTALLATGNVDKSDVNAINNEIAYQFLYDYIDTIISTDADTETFTNTLKMVGVEQYDLTQYETYYGYAKKALTNEGVTINDSEVEGFDISVEAKGAQALDLFSLIGFDLSQYKTYTDMVKEFKEGGVITGGIDATLKNTTVDYEAVVLDINAFGVQNKFDYTADLPARTASIAGTSIVVLLGDVDGDLSFNKGAAILDLNGKSVNGSISGSNLLIIDSCMGTADAGSVSGSISGTVHITGGNYASDVTAFLAEGYEQNGTTVSNKLYTIETNGSDVTFVLNTDIIDETDSINSYTSFAKAVAIDAAADLLLNYVTSAALSADGSVIYNVVLDDLIGLYSGAETKEVLINKVLNFVDAEDLTTFINAVIDDVMDFAAIEAAILNNENVAEYTLTTMPWSVNVEHKVEGDYITFGIVPNEALAESFKVALKLGGDKKSYVADLAGGLSEIVTANTDINVVIDQPTYADNHVNVSGSGKAVVELDLSKDQNTANDLRFSAKDYTTVLAVILANGNPDKADALIDAIDNRVALKEVIDTITVEEIFTALKALNRNDSFKSLAEELGVTDGGEHNDLVDKGYFDDEEKLESIYHIYLCAAGWALEKLDITGYTDKTLGALDQDGDGWYELSVKNKNPNGSVSYSGYGVNYDVVIEEITLRVNLFGGMLGDVDSDNDVDNVDAMWVLQYYVGLIDETGLNTAVADVNGDGEIDNVDAMYMLQHYVGLINEFPVEQ